MRTVLLPCLLAAPLVLIGCDTGADDDNPLAGHDFLLTDITGYEPVTDISLSFSEKEMSASGGCNGSGGPYVIEDDVLVIDEIWTTEMGCEDSRLHDQDGWLVGFLTDRPTISYEDPILTLTTDDVVMELTDREVVFPDMALGDAEWVLNTVIDGDAATNAAVETDPTWRFNEDGTVVVDSVCHTGSGDYTATNATITFSDMAWASAECPKESLFYDESIRTIFADGEVSWEIDESRLQIMRGEDGLIANAAE
ncbi:MAG: META domain-containing protein [Myxococcota bacterium]